MVQKRDSHWEIRNKLRKKQNSGCNIEREVN